MDTELQMFYVEKLKIAKALCDKIVAFTKQHPQEYKESDAIEQAKAITKIYSELPKAG